MGVYEDIVQRIAALEEQHKLLTQQAYHMDLELSIIKKEKSRIQRMIIAGKGDLKRLEESEIYE